MTYIQHYSNAIQNTDKFLHLISNHLSGRRDCRKVEYLVIVDPLYISMYPNIQVYNDVHNRADCNKVSVIDHILNKHASEFDSNIIEGKYLYKLSAESKYRKWVKIDG